MYLHEEYILRHNLDIPIVCHNKRSCIFLKSRDPVYEWSVLNIAWYDLDQSRHPGIYEIKLSKPIHNSFGKTCFTPVVTSLRVYWDEYYRKIMELVEYCRANKMVAMPASERMLCVWQMFLIIYDGWLASHMHPDFFSFVEQSTRTDLDINTRNIAFRKAYKLLSARSSSVCGFLEDEIMPLVRGHAVWLEKLINA